MITSELAYLVGAIRDGSIFYDKASRNYTLVWYEDNEKWLRESIALRIQKITLKKPKVVRYKLNNKRVRISSKNLFNLFINYFNFRSPQVLWNTPNPIKKSSDDIIAIYIAGFFDAEGDTDLKNYVIGFSQKNFDSLNFIANWLNKNGISTSKIFVADKKSNTLRFIITSKNNFRRFSELIKIEHPDKIYKLGILSQLT